MEGCDFGKRALQHVKNYEKGQYSYFQLLNIKNVFQHYIFSSLMDVNEDERLVMGISNIFKIDDRYINIDR
jgi:hypothetical protein